jgi:hypothetical protein
MTPTPALLAPAFDQVAWRALCEAKARRHSYGRGSTQRLDLMGFSAAIDRALRELPDADRGPAQAIVTAEFKYVGSMAAGTAELDAAAWRGICESEAGVATHGCGLSYDVYVSRFSSAINSLVTRYRPEHRDAALSVAREWGYATAEEIAQAERENLESGYCVHGIDPNCCPAGCGDLEHGGSSFDPPSDFGADHIDLPADAEDTAAEAAADLAPDQWPDECHPVEDIAGPVHASATGPASTTAPTHKPRAFWQALRVRFKPK